MNKTTNHEQMHPTGSESAWSESYYFNFVDPVSKIGMFTRMGFRPGDGWADALHVIYLENNRVAFTYSRRNIESDLTRYDGDLKVGDLRIECLTPHKVWSVNYTGPAQDIQDAALLLTRSKLRPEGWFKPAHLSMNLTFDCVLFWCMTSFAFDGRSVAALHTLPATSASYTASYASHAIVPAS